MIFHLTGTGLWGETYYAPEDIFSYYFCHKTALGINRHTMLRVDALFIINHVDKDAKRAFSSVHTSPGWHVEYSLPVTCPVVGRLAYIAHDGEGDEQDIQ